MLIIVLPDATQNSVFCILQVHSTCFWGQPHTSSGVHKTVTTASGTGQANLAWPRWREVAAQHPRFIILPIMKRVGKQFQISYRNS